METGAKIRWWRVLLGGFLIELALMVVAVALYSTLAEPDTALNLAVPPATLLAAVPIAAWVARAGPRPVFAGTMTGVAAIAIYAVTSTAGILAAPDQANLAQTFGPAYLASHVLKLAGGALGGWLVARRRAAD